MDLIRNSILLERVFAISFLIRNLSHWVFGVDAIRLVRIYYDMLAKVIGQPNEIISQTPQKKSKRILIDDFH